MGRSSNSSDTARARGSAMKARHRLSSVSALHTAHSSMP